MAIFDLRCRKCKRIMPDFKLAANGMIIQKCVCGSTDLEKLPPRVGIQFKGEGWSKPGATDASN